MVTRAFRRILVFQLGVFCSFLILCSISSAAFVIDVNEERTDRDSIDSLLIEIDRVNEATQSARNAVHVYEDSVFLPTLLFQLSELELKREKLYFNLELLKYDEAMASYSADSTNIQEPEEPMLTFKETLAINNRLLTEFPDAVFIDRVKYRTAICLFETGLRDSALIYFLDLSKSYPERINVPEINFRIGECFFDRQDFEIALSWYNRVLDFLDSPYFGMALYKRGWCFYRMNDYLNSISSFSYLLTDIKLLEEIDCELLQLTQSELIEEALDYIAISFVDYGNADVVPGYLEEIGAYDYAPAILLNMGDVYQKRDYNDTAISVYMMVISQYPLEELTPEAYYELFTCYLDQEEFDRAFQLRNEFAEKFGRSSAWMKRHTDTRHRTMLNELSRKMDLTIAMPKLTRADSLFSVTEYAKAAALYKNFVSMHSTDEAADRAAYYLAECYYELGKYGASAVSYEYVVKKFPDSEFAEDAGYNRIICYDQLNQGVVKIMPDTIRWRGHVVLFRTAYEAKVLESCSDFISRFGTSDRSVEIRLKMADLFLRNEYYEPAEQMLSDVLLAMLKYGRGQQYGAHAWQLMALAAFKGGKLKEAETYYDYLIKQYPDSTDLIENSKTMLASVSFRVAESLKYAGDAYRAAARFEQTSDTALDEPLAEAALFESALQFKKANKLVNAVNNFDKFTRRYPRSERYVDALYQGALIHEQLSQWHLAAKNYLAIYGHEPQTARGASALYAAGAAYESASDWHSMSCTFDEFVLQYSNDGQRYLEALFKAGYGREKGGRYREAHSLYQRVLAEFNGRVTHDEFADEYIAAQTQFRIGELMHRDFSAVKLQPPFESNMKRKQILFNQMMKQLVDVARYNVADWTTAAFYTIGHCYEEFCQDILSSPTPPELDRIQSRQYWTMIQDKWIKPLQKEALRYYAANQKLAMRNGVDNTWVQQTRDRISFLKGRLFASRQKDDGQKIRTTANTASSKVKTKRKDM